MNDFPPELTKLWPGAVGSAAAMLWIKAEWPRKVALFISGAALARFGAAWLAEQTKLDAGFAGFLLGLFGMAVVDSVFNAWPKLDLATLLRDALRKRLGLDPAPSTPKE